MNFLVYKNCIVKQMIVMFYVSLLFMDMAKREMCLLDATRRQTT